jgi:hypothetical protein
MTDPMPLRCTAFEGSRRIASGELTEVAAAVRAAVDRGTDAGILVFDDHTSELIELGSRGAEMSLEREAPRRPGRPRLGVVAREVTLLPRHWDWLGQQPGGASAALRRLVDQARKAGQGIDRVRRAREVTYRFMSAMAGDEPGFEEATRALFADDRQRFDQLTMPWPVDVRDHARKLALAAWPAAVME